MSVIVPAGKKRREWVPQDPMVKTASAEGAEVEEPKDELLEAAMGVLDRQAEEEKCDQPECEEKEIKAEDDTEVVEAGESCDEECEIEIEIEEEPASPDEVLDEVKEDGVVTEEEEEVIEEAAVEKIKGAVEVIEVALEEVVDAEEALEKVKDAIGTVEEVHEEMAADTDKPEEAEEDGDEVSFTEEVVEDSVEEAAEEGDEVLAGSNEEFQRFAKISPKNRAKVADYWKNSLGYPADYVDLLTKDYEK